MCLLNAGLGASLGDGLQSHGVGAGAGSRCADVGEKKRINPRHRPNQEGPKNETARLVYPTYD